MSLSFLFAGFACFLSAFCFAEFASIVKSSSGSSYSFIYLSLGELIAFLIGWMIFIGSLASIAATAITWSTYVDSTTNNTISNFVIEKMHASWDLGSPFSNHLDVSALFILCLLYFISLRGLRMSTMLNNILAILNISLLILISIAGFIYGKLENLQVPYTNGFDGIINGASIVMYAFMGFESSTCAIEETKNPSKNIPLSLIISLFIICLSYCGSSLALNLMQPYTLIDTHASYPSAFKSVEFMYWIVSIGPVISLTGSIISSIYSIARIAYTMAHDGLLFKFLSNINEHTKIPHIATITSFIISALLVLLVDINDLIGFSDIIGFLTYSLVAVGLLMIRYCNTEIGDESNVQIVNEEVALSSTGRIILKESCLNEELNEMESDKLLSESQSVDNLIITSQNLPNRKRTCLFSQLNDCTLKNSFFKNRKNAAFLIYFLFISNIFYFFLFHLVHGLKKPIVIVIVLSNCILTAALSCFKQNSYKVSFKVNISILLRC